MNREKYIMEDIKKLNEFIKTVDSVRVVKNCDEWDWQKKFPNFKSAVNSLLKQLAVQRKLLMISIIWQRNTLLNQSLNKTKPKIK